MKHYIYFFALVFAFGCSNEVNESLNDTDTGREANIPDSADYVEEDITNSQITTIPKVLIVPCANGYEYNTRDGDVNPSLEKYLSLDERITIVPFPLKKMQGAGYFGVYDKKNCSSILENTDVDFLVMTRMSGGLMPIRLLEDSTASPNWGYSTRILNVKTMEQFDGIRGSGFEAYKGIDPDVKTKASNMVELILESHTEVEP